MLIVALPASGPLAAGLARSLRCDWTELSLHTFPDGETLVRIDVPVKDRCVVLAGSLHDPDTKTLPLIFAADAARELGASQVGLVAPYLAYMRQDRRFNPGEAVTSRSYARLLSSSLDFLVTVDPHLHRWHSLQELYPIRTQAVASAPMIARWIAANVRSPLVIGPDEESEQWVREVARFADAPWAVMTKTRRGDRDVDVKLAHREQWPGRTPVLLDDIVSTGQTVAQAVAALREAGLPPPLCVVVHGLFATGAIDRIMRAGVSQLVTTDSIVHGSNAIFLEASLARALHILAGEIPRPPLADLPPNGNLLQP
jgi:ribose-phosphate pyrophosphokinase